MTYRNDLDALAAREAALAKEVAEKKAERDDVARKLEAAREREALQQRASLVATRNAIWRQGGIAVAVMLIAAGGAGFFLFRARPIHVSSPRVLTCEQAKPEHDKLEDQAHRNYTAALARKGLREQAIADTETVSIPIHFSDMAPQPNMEVDEAVERAKTGDVIPRKKNGILRSAYVGESSLFESSAASVDFAADASGGIWHVVRLRRSYPVKSLTTKACEWGCWGTPKVIGEQPQSYEVTLWFLPDGLTFRGDVRIEYDEPTIDETPTQKCGLAP